MVCRSFAARLPAAVTAGFANSLKTRLSARNSVSGAVDGKLEWKFPEKREPAGTAAGRRAANVGQAALVPESGDWGKVTMQHGSPPPGGQPEVSGGWTDGGGGWCVETDSRLKD